MFFTCRVLKIVWMVAFSMLSAVALAASPLEETEWQVEITQEGMTLPQYVDRLRFKEGKLVSVIFERKGFSASPYTLTAAGVWKAEQKNDAVGNLTWHGELRGEKMTGTLVLKEPDGKVTNYALNGSPAVAVEEGETPAPEGTSLPTKKGKKGFFGCSLSR